MTCMLPNRIKQVFSFLSMHLYARCGWGSWALPVMPYGQRWRTLRRTFWQHFRPTVINKWNIPLENGARKLLTCLLDSPQSLIENIRL